MERARGVLFDVRAPGAGDDKLGAKVTETSH